MSESALEALVAAAIAVSEDASPNSDGALMRGEAVVAGYLLLNLRKALAAFPVPPASTFAGMPLVVDESVPPGHLRIVPRRARWP